MFVRAKGGPQRQDTGAPPVINIIAESGAVACAVLPGSASSMRVSTGCSQTTQLGAHAMRVTKASIA